MMSICGGECEFGLACVYLRLQTKYENKERIGEKSRQGIFTDGYSNIFLTMGIVYLMSAIAVMIKRPV
jgi:hypothetical protein